MCPAQPAKGQESASSTLPPLPMPGLEDSLTRLIGVLGETAQALKQAADSMAALAQSNQALIQAMSEMGDDGMEQGGMGSQYLNGSRTL